MIFYCRNKELCEFRQVKCIVYLCTVPNCGVEAKDEL